MAIGKAPKTTDFNAFIPKDGIKHTVKNSIYYGLRLLAWQVCLLRYSIYQL